MFFDNIVGVNACITLEDDALHTCTSAFCSHVFSKRASLAQMHTHTTYKYSTYKYKGILAHTQMTVSPALVQMHACFVLHFGYD